MFCHKRHKNQKTHSKTKNTFENHTTQENYATSKQPSAVCVIRSLGIHNMFALKMISNRNLGINIYKKENRIRLKVF
jgi:hypothetical protein